MSKKILVFIIVCSSIIIGGIWYYIASGSVSTDDARVKMGNSQIIPEVMGYIGTFNIYEGKYVKRGDVLLRLDETQYKIDYDRNVALLSQAKSNLKYARTAYNGRVELLKKQLISELEFVDYKRSLDIAIQNEKQAKTGVDLAKYRLDRSVIKASIDGKISNFNLKIGDYALVGRPLFNIVDEKDIWIEANFKEKDLGNIKVGQIADVSVDSKAGKVFKAKVINISPATESEFSILPSQNTSGNWIKVVQRVQVRLQFEPDEDIKDIGSGFSAIVNINIRQKK